MRFRDTIPQELVAHTTAMCGKLGDQWLDSLPELIGYLEERWSITVREPFPSIEFNFVASATDTNGHRTVIKISPPFENAEIFSEAKFLRTLNGRGTVMLLREDRERRAILIERAVPGADLTNVFAGDQMAAIDPAVKVLEAITTGPPDDRRDVIDLDDWFDGLTRYEETDFPQRYGETALAMYAELSDGIPKYYLHGDFHPANIVTATREPFLAIDPKGIIGPVGYDIAVFLNNFNWWQDEAPDIRDRLAIAIDTFSSAFQISEANLRRWAYAQMVLSAWWTFDEMPGLYENEVVKADIWDI